MTSIRIFGSLRLRSVLVLLFPLVLSAGIDKGYKMAGRDDFHFGLKLGLNNSNVYDEAGDEFVADSRIGLAFGAFASIPFDKLIGFQPEILVSQKGFNAKGKYFGNSYNFSRTSTFLDIPLLLQVKPAGPLYLLAGPQYSYLMHTADVFHDGTLNITQEEEISKYNYRKNILGFVVGADVKFALLVLSARAGWDVTKNHGDGTSSNPRYKNHWVQFTAGLAF